MFACDALADDARVLIDEHFSRGVVTAVGREARLGSRNNAFQHL